MRTFSRFLLVCTLALVLCSPSQAWPSWRKFASNCHWFFRKIAELPHFSERTLSGARLRAAITMHTKKREMVTVYLDELKPVHLVTARPTAIATSQKRAQVLREHQAEVEAAGMVLSRELQDKLIPSRTPIRVTKDGEGRYVIFDGNGRFDAISKAFPGRIKVEVEHFDHGGSDTVVAAIEEGRALRPSIFERLDSFIPKTLDNGFDGESVNPNGKTVKLRFHFADRKYGEEHGLIYERPKAQDLPRNAAYTFIITEDGSWSFGRIENGWEFGVKHANLANGRRVKIAGEVKIAEDGSYTYNFSSGTYMERILRRYPTSRDDYMSKVEAIGGEKLADFFGHPGVKAGLEPLTPRGPPTEAELRKLCASAIFRERNASLCP